MNGAEPPQFATDFDQQFSVGEAGNTAHFGRNVLAGLVDGISDFIHVRQPRWNRHRAIGPALLGSAMWIDDPELIDTVAQLTGACVVVTKQGRSKRDEDKLAALRAVNDRTPGLRSEAFW